MARRGLLLIFPSVSLVALREKNFLLKTSTDPRVEGVDSLDNANYQVSRAKDARDFRGFQREDGGRTS